MPDESHIQETLKRKVDSLPTGLKAAVSPVPLPAIVFEVGKKHELAIDKIGILGDITYEFILGYVGAEDFVAEIEQRLDIAEEKSLALARDINKAVFAPIRDAMKQAPVQPEAQPQAKPRQAPLPPAPKIVMPPASPITQPETPAQPPVKQAQPPPTGTPTQAQGPFQPITIYPFSRPQAEDAKPPPALPIPPDAVPPSASLPAQNVPEGKTAPPVVAPLNMRTAAGITRPPVTGGAPGTAMLPTDKKEPAQSAAPLPKTIMAKPEEPTRPLLSPASMAAPLPQPLPPKPEAMARQQPPPAPATKETLESAIEQFRQPPDNGQQKTADALKPLDLPQKKNPSPPAPEKYDIDPYKEPIE